MSVLSPVRRGVAASVVPLRPIAVPLGLLGAVVLAVACFLPWAGYAGFPGLMTLSGSPGGARLYPLLLCLPAVLLVLHPPGGVRAVRTGAAFALAITVLTTLFIAYAGGGLVNVGNGVYVALVGAVLYLLGTCALASEPRATPVGRPLPDRSWRTPAEWAVVVLAVTDHSYDQVPAMGSILLARETPPTGGDTLFASLGAAYDALSDDLKSQIENLRAVHSADHVYSADGVYAKTDLAGDLKGHDVRTMAVHPVVIHHPVTGRKILYVNPAFTLHFEGWTQVDSMPLLYELYAVALRKEFHCRLSWALGSIAIWDNRSTWHFANNDYQGHRRLMHRITISGVPIGA